MKTLIPTVAALVLVAGCTGTQPPPPCLAAHGSYAVQYTPTGTPAPAGSTCALSVGIVGVQKYNQADGGMPTLALRPAELADGTSAGIALGTFADPKPDDQKLCYVNAFTSDAVTGTITYKFSNVDLYVDAHAPGTQMSFDVEVSDSSVPCTATYSALAVWPVVGCSFEGSTKNPNPFPPSDANCAFVDGSLSGYGWSWLAINPDFDVQCAPEPNDWIGWWNTDDRVGRPTYDIVHVQSICVLRKPIPSFCPPEGCSWRTE